MTLRLVVAWCALAAALGGLASALAVQINPSLSGRTGEVFAVWMLAVYALTGLLLGLAHGAFAAAIDRLWPHERRGSSALAAVAIAALGLAAAGFATRLLASPGWRFALRLALLLGILPLASLLGCRIRLGPGRSLLGVLGGVLLCALASSGVASSALHPRSLRSTANPPPHIEAGLGPVVLLGIDGADWRSIDRLFAKGALPHLHALVRAGVRAPLRTTLPTWSPIIWNSIATGLPGEQHGVLDFTELRLPGMACGVVRARKNPLLLPAGVGLRRILPALYALGVAREVPVSACQRRAKAVWDMLSDAGRTAAVVDWFASYPSDPIHGYVVSDDNPSRAAFNVARGEGQHGRMGMTYPPELMNTLAKLPIQELPDAPEGMLRLPFFSALRPAERRELLERPGMLAVFRLIQRSDTFSAAAAEWLLRKDPSVAFLAVYLSGVDNVSHRFGHRTGVVDRYYAYTDTLVGRLVAAARPGTTFVVVSDHGWNYGGAKTFGHKDAPDGIFLASGPGIAAPGSLAESPQVFDVAPTLLALLGMPREQAMVGRAVLPALAADRRRIAAEPPHDYGRYANQGREDEATRNAGLRNETLERLRALGYIR